MGTEMEEEISLPYIFDFNEFEYMVIESEDGDVIAEIRQDSIDVEDGYRIRMCRRRDEA